MWAWALVCAPGKGCVVNLGLRTFVVYSSGVAIACVLWCGPVLCAMVCGSYGFVLYCVYSGAVEAGSQVDNELCSLIIPELFALAV